jgi:hypothetical protein
MRPVLPHTPKANFDGSAFRARNPVFAPSVSESLTAQVQIALLLSDLRCDSVSWERIHVAEYICYRWPRQPQ